MNKKGKMAAIVLGTALASGFVTTEGEMPRIAQSLNEDMGSIQEDYGDAVYK